jgi:hypothetical protein
MSDQYKEPLSMLLRGSGTCLPGSGTADDNWEGFLQDRKRCGSPSEGILPYRIEYVSFQSLKEDDIVYCSPQFGIDHGLPCPKLINLSALLLISALEDPSCTKSCSGIVQPSLH